MMPVLLRCDASARIGTGHVARCLTLADELARRGFAPQFAMRLESGHMAAEVKARGYSLLALPARETVPTLELQRCDAAQIEDAQAVLAAAGANGDAHWDWVVVDHYALGAEWHRALRPATKRLAVIDDLADRAHECDLLVDVNLQQPGRYTPWLPPNAITLLGPAYALLRPEFRGAGRMPVPAAFASSRPLSVLVCFGGADAPGGTLAAVHALAQAGVAPPLQVTVVAGARNPHMAELKQLCGDCGFALLASSNRMAQLMTQADLAIGAGGSMLLERCAMGLPSIVVPIADNQRPGARCALTAGAIALVDIPQPQWTDAIGIALKRLANDADARALMSAAARQLCDGAGAARVAQTLQQGALTLRTAQLSDSDALLQWRNAPQTRRHSGDGHNIPLVTHRRWLDRTLKNPMRRLWIGEAGGQPRGVLRFDQLDDGAEAEISVYLVPDAAGKGWGRSLIAAGTATIAREWPQLRAVRARISDDNLASLRAFGACGFEPGQEPGIYRLLLQGRAS